MRFRQLTAIALAVPLLAACGGTSPTSHGDPSSSPSSSPSGTASGTASGASSAAASPTGPTGPVLDGQTFTLTLPPGGRVRKPIVSWSHDWDMGDDWTLSGVAIEESCDGGCEENTPASRTQEAKFLIHDRRDQHEKREPDVVVGGITMAHTSGQAGKHANESYGVQYHGIGYRFIFEINLLAGSRQHAEDLIQQILSTIRFKD